MVAFNAMVKKARYAKSIALKNDSAKNRGLRSINTTVSAPINWLEKRLVES
jgi:hypothetical protein